MTQKLSGYTNEDSKEQMHQELTEWMPDNTFTHNLIDVKIAKIQAIISIKSAVFAKKKVFSDIPTAKMMKSNP